MKNKKGFTLIELLAVIVILAIIALIATPIILNMIENAKVGAAKDSAYGYIEAIEYNNSLADFNEKYTKIADGTYSDFEQLSNVKVKGKVPDYIEYTILKGSVIKAGMCINNINIDYINNEAKKSETDYCKFATVNSITINNKVTSIENGATLQLDITVDPSNVTPSYISSDETVATISNTGLIETKQPGKTTISVKAGVKVEKFELEVLKSVTAIDYLLEKANPASITTYSAGTTTEMYTFSHEATAQTTALIDYRYIGKTPNNYIKFNDEVWRIIGIFEIDGKKLIKIIRNDVIGFYQYNSSASNDWASSTISQYLNGDYYNSMTTSAKEKINSTKFYLGGGESIDGQGGEVFYQFERGEKVYDGRSKNWTGNVGLMYASDYIYPYAYGVVVNCFNDLGNSCSNKATTEEKANNWLRNSNATQFLITQNSKYENYVFYVHEHGYLRSKYGSYEFGIVTAKAAIRPVVYLKANVKIVDGDGSSEKPYILK